MTVKTWMYVPGALSGGELAALKEAGVTGVMGPKEIAAPALAQGLQVLLCGGAFPAAGFAGEDHLALDIRGRRRVWFYSCCPNHGPTRQANLAMYRELAATPGIGGLVIDGARFASPASSFQPEAFFTCFCPRCLEKMAELGFDPERVQEGVSALYAWLRESGPKPGDWSGVGDWLTFRRRCATEHLKDFAALAHQAGVEAGAFFFAPSLAGLVGQSYRDMAGVMDFLSPMLYPAYPQQEGDPGTACLNWELYALGRLLAGAMGEEAARRELSRQMGYELPPLENLKREAPRGLIAAETARAREEAGPARVTPILQLDDPGLPESVAQAQKGGAGELAFFAYRKELLPALREALQGRG